MVWASASAFGLDSASQRAFSSARRLEWLLASGSGLLPESGQVSPPATSSVSSAAGWLPVRPSACAGLRWVSRRASGWASRSAHGRPQR